MKQKILKMSYLVFILFALKMIVYYIAVDIPIFTSLSYWVTMIFFGLALFLYCNSSKRTRKILGFVYVIFSIVLFIDVIYYNYFNQLVSVNQIWQIKNIKGTEDSVKSAIPLMSVLILIDIPVLWFIRRRFRHRFSEVSEKPISKKMRRWIAFGLVFQYYYDRCKSISPCKHPEDQQHRGCDGSCKGCGRFNAWKGDL